MESSLDGGPVDAGRPLRLTLGREVQSDQLPSTLVASTPTGACDPKDLLLI